MKKIIGILVLISLAFPIFSQSSISQAQSLFIYNFSRMIEWPANYRSGTFIIGILGTTNTAMELESYTKGKKVGTQDIQVIRYKTPAEIQKCHILFVPFARTKQLPEVISSLNGKSTLIITEKSGALNEGAAINFVIVADKIKFETRAENASKFGIKFSSKLNEMSSGS